MTEANSINAATTGIVGNTGTAFTGTAVTQYNVIVGGATSSTLSNVAPSATTGVPLISQGAASNPVFGTAVVAGGGTGSASFTTYGPVVAASTSTGALTSVAPSATSGVPLISQGAASNPAFGTAVVAGGGTGLTSTTAYAVICGGTTSTGALQSIAGVGTSGQVLTSNGAGALPTFQAAGSGALVQLATRTASASASLEFKSVISGTYNTYLISYSNLTPATANASLEMVVSTDNGSTYIATNYISGWIACPYNSFTWTNASSTTFIYITLNTDNNQVGSGNIWLSNTGNGGTFQCYGDGIEFAGGGTVYRSVIAGTNTATTVNAVKVSMSSGNITSGTFTMYGLTGS